MCKRYAKSNIFLQTTFWLLDRIRDIKIFSHMITAQLFFKDTPPQPQVDKIALFLIVIAISLAQ